jgi:hypothetical protein
MSHVFVSYSTKDKVFAERLVRRIEATGMACWMAPRDIPPGDNFQAAIVAAIEASSVLLVLISKNTNNSVEILKELSVAGDSAKFVVPARIENILPTGGLRYPLSHVQFIDLFDAFEENFQLLCDRLTSASNTANEIIGGELRAASTAAPVMSLFGSGRAFLIQNRLRSWVLATIVAVGLTGIGATILTVNEGAPDAVAPDAPSRTVDAPSPVAAPPTVQTRSVVAQETTPAPPNAQPGTAAASTGTSTPQATASAPLSCEEFRRVMTAAGRPFAVSCNANTAPGYYWAIGAPKIRTYGFWGMRGVGGTPRCEVSEDIGRGGETATFNTSTTMWEVREYWCRVTSQTHQCTGKNDEGPIFAGSGYFDGVFSAECRRQ